MARVTTVYPISGEDVMALPVRGLAGAIGYHETALGFSVVRQDGATAVLERDGIQIGLVLKPDHEPGKAGSLAFGVDDIEGMHRELEGSGAHPGKFGVDEWDGQRHRTFFVREDGNGYCYCFHSPLTVAAG